MKSAEFKIVKKWQDGGVWYVPKRKIYFLWCIPLYYNITSYIYKRAERAEGVINKYAYVKGFENIIINKKGL
jgi:hypothetical protein